MDAKGLAQTILDQFVTAWAQPVPTLTMAVLIGLILWWFIRREFQTRLDNAQSTITLKDSQLQDYKDKLSGRTPDEARARIEALENEVLKLQPRQRSLSSEQKETIANTVRGFDFKGSRVEIIYNVSSLETALYADDFVTALREGGWPVRPDTIVGAQRVRAHGINLAVHSMEKRSEAALKLGEALGNAQVAFNWLEQPGLSASARLYVDLAED